jgi:hypothetical protein
MNNLKPTNLLFILSDEHNKRDVVKRDVVKRDMVKRDNVKRDNVKRVFDSFTQ